MRINWKELADTAKAELGIILILVAVYFLQIATPLRLHPDTVVLLSVAETAEHGGGYLYHGQPTVFPPGYPSVLALLIRVNLAHVWVIVSLNVIFVVIGLVMFRYIFRSKGFSEPFVLGVCMLSLLSFVFVKYSAIPLTDMFFFGVTMCGLALMKQSVALRFSWARLIGCVALVIAAMCIRRIGVALIPALLYTMMLQSDVRVYLVRLSRRMKVTIIIAVASVAAAFGAIAIVWGIRTASTLVDLGALLRGHRLIESSLSIMSFRFRELGEIGVNLPYHALPQILQGCIPSIGVLILLLVFAGVAWRKRFDVVDTYFLSYVAVILVWPFYDPRFWLPVIPLLIAYAAVVLNRRVQNQVVRYIAEAYLGVFILTGIFTLTSDTKLSFSGSGFADLYAEGRYHATYCAVWHCRDVDSTNLDPDGLHLLRYYNQNER